MTDNPLITIVCVSYKRYNEIKILINSILVQTFKNWKLVIIHDGKNEHMKRTVRPYLRDPRIEYKETDTRYNNWGHSLREIELKRCKTKYIMWTNDDNYYVPVFLKKMIKVAEKKDLDFVFCNLLHSHYDYKVFSTKPMINHIDMGAFIVKTKVARKVGFTDHSFAADGIFVEKLMQVDGLKRGKIKKVLFVHN